MKLIRFSQGDSKPRFGVVIGGHAIAFASLQQRSGVDRPELSDSFCLTKDMDKGNQLGPLPRRRGRGRRSPCATGLGQGQATGTEF
jgi:hypothetical protein